MFVAVQVLQGGNVAAPKTRCSPTRSSCCSFAPRARSSSPARRLRRGSISEAVSTLQELHLLPQHNQHRRGAPPAKRAAIENNWWAFAATNELIMCVLEEAGAVDNAANRQLPRQTENKARTRRCGIEIPLCPRGTPRSRSSSQTRSSLAEEPVHFRPCLLSYPHRSSTR